MLRTEVYSSCGCGHSSCFYCFEETFVASLQFKQGIFAIEDPYLENKCDLTEVKIETEHTPDGESFIDEPECKTLKLEDLAVNHTNKQWIPPKSPYNLIQETLFHDPWQLLVATIFLNRTNAKVALPLFWKFVDKWSTPHCLGVASVIEIAALMKPLGLNVRRALQLKQFTYDFLNKDWQYPRQLHGIGQYGDDSYRIFCVNEWKSVQPKDKELKKYMAWLCKNHHRLKL